MKEKEWDRKLEIDADDTLTDLLCFAYSQGWRDGYKEKGVEFDWIDEGFNNYLDKLSVKD